MSQTKKQSLIESLSNTAVGFGVSFASTFLIFPLMGFASSTGKNLIITLYFTIISILRGYVIRRWFNKKPKSTSEYFTYPDGSYFEIHCYQCEIEMPVIKDERSNLWCANCGLRHKSIN